MTRADPILVDRHVLERALRKARIEYERVAEQEGHPLDTMPPGECWREFERLAEYMTTAPPEDHYELAP
jgi:hypothetical protein